MLSRDSGWIAFLLGRALCHALAGALACGVFGCALMGVSGAVIGWGSRLDISYCGLAGCGMTAEGAALGAQVGSGVGALVGSLIFAILGLTLAPRRSLWPPRSSIWPIGVAMSFATAGMMTIYLPWCIALAPTRDMFHSTSYQHVFFLVLAVPAAMTCGQIAGAVLLLRRQHR